MKLSNNKISALIDFKINIKIKLAALWTATTLCYLYGDYFQLYIPGQVESLISGDNSLNTPVMLFIASVILSMPPLMIVLSLILKPSMNRILNIVLGSIFTLMMVSIAIDSLKPWYAFYVFLATVEAVLTIIIVWIAFQWPRQNEQQSMKTMQ